MARVTLSAPDASAQWIYRLNWDQPCSVQIWGDSRVAVNRVAFEIARVLNPRYVWVDIGNPGDEAHPDEPARSGMIPPEMLYRAVSPERMAPDHAAANLALWSVIRPDEPTEVLHPLVDFLRLPQLIQEVVGNSPKSGRPAVWVASNVDRVLQHYPDDPAIVQPMLDVYKRERVTTIVTLLDHARKTRFLYDYVFEVRAGRGPEWNESAIVCEKASENFGFKVGTELQAFSST